MKKKLALTLSLLLVCLTVLTACGGKTAKDFTNTTWAVTYALDEDGNKETAESAGLTFTLEFKEDSVCSINMMGQSAECKWELDGSKIVLTNSGNDEKLEFKIDGNKLSLENDGATAYFEKQ